MWNCASILHDWAASTSRLLISTTNKRAEFIFFRPPTLLYTGQPAHLIQFIKSESLDYSNGLPLKRTSQIQCFASADSAHVPHSCLPSPPSTVPPPSLPNPIRRRNLTPLTTLPRRRFRYLAAARRAGDVVHVSAVRLALQTSAHAPSTRDPQRVRVEALLQDA